MATEYEYSARDGSQISKEQAARYGSRITQLTERKGFITPDLVVLDATNKNSPLHDFFDWDDTEAAKKWRVEQAKYLIRHIIVTIVDGDEPEEIRQFYSVTPSEDMKTDVKKVYVTLSTIMTDGDKRKEVIAYALRELKGWTERYRQYSELAPFVSAIDKQLKKVKK